MAKAFIFDLDGVVTDTAELHYRAWQRLADRFGLPFDRAINERLKGVSRAESLRVILAGRPCKDEQFALMLEEKNRDYIRSLDQLGPDDILEGIPELLSALRLRGTPVSIASASRNARTILARLGLGTQFDAVSDGFSVRNSKPAPDVFVHAAGQLGYPCTECLVFEDAAAGVAAAKSAGMRVVGIGHHLDAAEPDLLVASTAELKKTLFESDLVQDYGSD